MNIMGFTGGEISHTTRDFLPLLLGASHSQPHNFNPNFARPQVQRQGSASPTTRCLCDNFEACYPSSILEPGSLVKWKKATYYLATFGSFSTLSFFTSRFPYETKQILKTSFNFCMEKILWIQVVMIFGIPMKGGRVGEWVFVVDLKVHLLNQPHLDYHFDIFKMGSFSNSESLLWYLWEILNLPSHLQ